MPKDILKNEKLIIGFDPKLLTKQNLNLIFGKNHCVYKPLNKNLIDKFWKRKIIEDKDKFYSLPKKSVGQDYKTKIAKIVLNLKKNNSDFQFISASENNAWLLNIRGRDTKFTPVPYSYGLIDRKKNTYFFCDQKKNNCLS